MGSHIVNGQFQSDKYPTCPPGKVPLSVKDKSAQDLLWEYAQRRRAVDAEFSADLEMALVGGGYIVPLTPPSSPLDVLLREVDALIREAVHPAKTAEWSRSDELESGNRLLVPSTNLHRLRDAKAALVRSMGGKDRSDIASRSVPA